MTGRQEAQGERGKKEGRALEKKPLLLACQNPGVLGGPQWGLQTSMSDKQDECREVPWERRDRVKTGD